MRDKIAFYIIEIAFRIMKRESLEDVYATLIHWNRQRKRFKK
jgi:hypothetical protein